MKEMSKFQIIFIGAFAAFIVIGVAIFSMNGGLSKSKPTSKVTVWGILPKAVFNETLHSIQAEKDKTLVITYVQKNADTFDTDFIEALASGTGPDLFVLPQDSILKHQDKIVTIPFTSYSERDFKANFVQEGELFLNSTGAIALPFTIDPLVMYWNRDLFSNEGLSLPPKNWSEFYDLADKLTKKDANLNVTQSAASLGEFSNITHATELVSLLAMQVGSPLISRVNGALKNDITYTPPAGGVSSIERALVFYTEFSNPLKPFYSWNRSLPNSKNYFLSGDLAIYFGFASELAELQQKNPNLNFAVAPVPEPKDVNSITFGKITGLAVTKSSKDVAGAYRAAVLLSGDPAIAALSKLTHLPPVRRSLLAVKQSDDAQSVFYQGAIQARGWLSPTKAETDKIFQNMIESVTSGRNMPSETIQRARDEFDIALKGKI